MTSISFMLSHLNIAIGPPHVITWLSEPPQLGYPPPQLPSSVYRNTHCQCCYIPITYYFMFMVMDGRSRRRWRTGAACIYIASSSAAAVTSTQALIIAIVYFLDRWRILMCFGYTTIEFVYFFVKVGISSTYLFLGYWPSSFAWSHCRCNVRAIARLLAALLVFWIHWSVSPIVHKMHLARFLMI